MPTSTPKKKSLSKPGTSDPRGNRCNICQHKDIKEINRTIVRTAGYAEVVKRYGLANTSLSKHTKRCLNVQISALIDQRKEEQALDVYAELIEQFKFAKELRNAAKKYLSDPDNPGWIDLIPQANEIDVIYETKKIAVDGRGDQGRYRRRKKKLSSVIQMIEASISPPIDPETLNDIPGKTIETVEARDESLYLKFTDGTEVEWTRRATTEVQQLVSFEIRHVDIRSFALDAIKTADTVLDRFAKLGGLYMKERENDVSIEKVLQSYSLWLSKNPQAAEKDKAEAIGQFARGGQVDELELAKRIGIDMELISEAAN